MMKKMNVNCYRSQQRKLACEVKVTITVDLIIYNMKESQLFGKRDIKSK
jgi:hypothetical protein